LNGIVRFVVKSIFKQFTSCWCIFNFRNWCRLILWLFNKDFDQQIQWIRDIFFIKIQDQFIKIQDQDLCSSEWWYLCQFRLFKLVARRRCSAWFKGLMVGSTILLFFSCFYWRSYLRLLEFFPCYAIWPGLFPCYVIWRYEPYVQFMSLSYNHIPV
jgi:hypothetical protein